MFVGQLAKLRPIVNRPAVRFTFPRALIFVLIAMLAACSRPAPIGPKVDPALITLMPPDTVLAVGARVETILQTPTYQRHFAELNLGPVDDFARQTGMDPRKSLWELLLVSDGKHRVVLGRGRFGDQMEAKLERDGASRMPYKAFNLLGTEQLAVVFLNDTTAAVGDAPSLRALIDARPNAHGAPPAIAERMKDIPPEAQLWAVYTGSVAGMLGSLPPLEGNLANLNRLAASLQGLSVYTDLRAGINAQLHGVYVTEADARTAHDALKALVGFGRLSTPSDQPDMLRVYDGITVTQQVRDVRVALAEPQDLADKFLKQWTGH
jgi:hypothetical protein